MGFFGPCFINRKKRGYTEVKRIILILVSFLIAGCSLGPASITEPKKDGAEAFPEKIRIESEKLNQAQEQLLDSTKKHRLKIDAIHPVMPKYDPLEDHIVSFSMVDESLDRLLYSLSQAVGMNLIINPEIQVDDKKLTLNFVKVPANVVLKEITSAYGLYYEAKQNVIRIKPYQEQIFKLNFLDTNVRTTFQSGGSVQDSGDSDSGEGSSGYFKLEGEAGKTGDGNAYDVIESVIKQVKSPKGQYSINRLGGSLYIKDKPAVIQAIAKLVNQFKRMMSRQILIEARIIEVTLSDGYKYGIDWNLLRRDENSEIGRLLNASTVLTQGLVVGGVVKEFTLDATIDALRTFGETKVVSNPSIRTKHGKPAVISVGTRISYTKSVTTTQETENTAATSEPQAGSVFDGLILGVIPFIEENDNITLMINPIKSDVDATSLELQNFEGGNQITLPRVNVKEINTTIVVKSGDLVILGGLIDSRLSTENKGVPGLSAIPLLGYLFKSEVTNEETREMVIFLRVKVI